MESKKINRQFNSFFWGIIYVMPLLILVITYFGYFNMYKENQEYNIEANTNYNKIYESNFIPDNGFISDVYVNKSLPVSDVVSIFETLTFVPYNEYFDIWFCVTDSTTKLNNLGVLRFKQDDHYDYGISVTINGENIAESLGGDDFVFYSDTSSDSYTNGWLNSFNGVLSFNCDNALSLIASSFNFIPENKKIKNLFYVNDLYYLSSYNDTLMIPNKIINNGVESTEYLSLFDLSIKHTINTFDGFVFGPLHNTFTSVLPKINFANDTLIAQLVILIFTWFVQGMFIHIIVDTITLVPKMYHKMMERWLG